jgi:hypothetical protein
MSAERCAWRSGAAWRRGADLEDDFAASAEGGFLWLQLNECFW